MRILQHPITTALGITTLSLLFLIGPLVSPNHEAIYHLSGMAGPVFILAGIYFGYLWLLISGLLLIAEKHRVFWFPAWLGVLLFLPWIVLKNYVMLVLWPISHRTMVHLFLATLAVYLVALLFRPAILRKKFPSLQSVASVVLGFAAFAGLATLVRLPYEAWAARDFYEAFPLLRARLTTELSGYYLTSFHSSRFMESGSLGSACPPLIGWRTRLSNLPMWFRRAF
jgi:hypothetical protein